MQTRRARERRNEMTKRLSHRFCVAPMMARTDRHCRVFHRLLTRKAVLYTEMATADAILHGDPQRLLAFDDSEHPIACQLGGSEPEKLAAAARQAAEAGYDEINLNAGCPSARVRAGRIGACLMAEPSLVSDCLRAMREAVSIPVTVKCRIGIDDADPQVMLACFARAVFETGVTTVIVHARKAWLRGLSPRENREVPPLDHARVYRLKAELPALEIVINGGITSLEEAESHLAHVDGVMLGRAAYESPALLSAVDSRFFHAQDPSRSLRDAVLCYMGYMKPRLEEGVPLWALTRPLLGLFRGEPGARAFRRLLSVEAHRPGANLSLLAEALSAVTCAPPSAAAA
jgi:tRNA-dihydrouridine synthase A